MSLLQEKLRAAQLVRMRSGSETHRVSPTPRSREARAILMQRWHGRPYQLVTVTCNKGGVGKTTLAGNLAVYVRALREQLPILVLGLDDQPSLDRLFALDEATPKETVASGLRQGSFASAIRLGQYGVHYVPSDPGIATLKRELEDPLVLHRALERTGWTGLVVVDTKSDLEILTRSAIAASDLCLVPVRDDASLREARRIFDLLAAWTLPRERARVVLSMVDRRIRYGRGREADLLALLLSEIRRQGWPLLTSFLSNSPKVQSLATNPDGAVHSIMHGARSTLVHRQMLGLAREVLALLPEVALRQAALH
jgi:chromosome partitioning protein